MFKLAFNTLSEIVQTYLGGYQTELLPFVMRTAIIYVSCFFQTIKHAYNG